MLKFENYTPENLKKYAPYIKNCPYNVNDVSVGSFFMWNEGVNLKFAEQGGAFISVQDICGEPSFSYPFGGNEAETLEEIIDYVKANDLPLKFTELPKKRSKKSKTTRFFQT